jgi:superkiller protein 3
MIPFLVLAETYKWIDDKGGIHFTDDYSTIPEKHRQEIEKRTLPKDSLPNQPEKRINKIEPEFEIRTLINRSAVLMDMGRVDEAIALLLRVIKSDPNNGAAYGNLGAAYYKKGQLDKAIEAFKKAVELDPKDEVARQNLGNAYTDAKKYDQAIVEHKKRIEFDPRNADAFVDLSVAYFEKGNYAEGMSSLKKALSINPNHPLARMNLGRHYRELKKGPEAIDELLYARDLGMYPEVYEDLENDLRMTFQMCFSDLEKWARDEPNNPLSHYYFAYALMYNNKDWPKAMKEIDRAIELDKSNGRFRKAKAVLYLSQGREKETIAACKECIRVDPSSWGCYNLLCEEYMSTENMKEALGAALKAVAINPNALSTQFNVGSAYALNGENEKALEAFKKARSLSLSLHKEHRGIHFNLAATYFNLKNYEMAWQHVRIAQRMGEEVNNLIQELKKVSKEPD